jgi:hypothetical protein
MRRTNSKGGRRRVVLKDPKKESTIQGLCTRLVDAGFTVRREELKRGLGWKAVSGRCRALEQRLVFVDRRLSQDEQIAFLQGMLTTLGVDASPEAGEVSDQEHVAQLEDGGTNV